MLLSFTFLKLLGVFKIFAGPRITVVKFVEPPTKINIFNRKQLEEGENMISGPLSEEMDIDGTKSSSPPFTDEFPTSE